VLADPHRSVLLLHTKVEVLDESLRGRLRLYALLAPHIARYGTGNSGFCSDIGATKLLYARRGGVHLIVACSPGFSRRSVGYVGASDGWQESMGNFKMDWEFHKAERATSL
jgi:glucoamylase